MMKLEGAAAATMCRAVGQWASRGPSDFQFIHPNTIIAIVIVKVKKNIQDFWMIERKKTLIE
jgi:hypothetical protein